MQDWPNNRDLQNPISAEPKSAGTENFSRIQNEEVHSPGPTKQPVHRLEFPISEEGVQSDENATNTPGAGEGAADGAKSGAAEAPCKMPKYEQVLNELEQECIN